MRAATKWFYIIMAGVTLWGGLVSAWYEASWLDGLGTAIAAVFMAGIIFAIARAIGSRKPRRSFD
jgi:hypothetical protein